jgi:hypothetical protein
MRRLPSILLSVFLGLLLGLGPLLIAAPALAGGWANVWSANAEESHLPACCRRHGVHHCNMDAGAGFSLAGHTHETTISANGCCPCWPGVQASSTAPFAAIFTHSTELAFTVALRSAPQAEIAAGISDRRTWPQRGPPSQTL